MYRRLAHGLLAIAASLAVTFFATVAVSHGHFPGKSQEDSHCAMCMAVHSGHRVLASPVVALQFTPVRWNFLAVNAPVAVSSSQFLPTQGRAPPLI